MNAGHRRRPHPVFYAMALVDHWQGQGALVLNGADAMAIDASRARQLVLINRLGLAAPATRVVHDRRALLAAACAIGFPVVVKADISGDRSAGACFDSIDALAVAADAGSLPFSVNSVWLCQALVRPRGGITTRIELLGGRQLYALDSSDADDGPGPVESETRTRRTVQRRRVRAEPPPALISAAEAIARAAGMDTCGVEYMIDDRCGTPRFQEINILSPFVDDLMDVIGWDPHDRLVERLQRHIRRMGG